VSSFLVATGIDVFRALGDTSVMLNDVDLIDKIYTVYLIETTGNHI